ncbi:MAG: hypothetical protein AAF465_13065 [Pseudomonadota bacterium]
MGDNTDGQNNDPIPFAALPPPKNPTIPVAIAAFVGALAGAIIGSQLT